MPQRAQSKAFGPMAAVACFVALLATWMWLRQPYPAHDQIKLAETFVDLLRSQRLVEAYELTLKTQMELPTNESFPVFATRQICESFKIAEIFPFQSRGNRLRRWISGQEIEMPELNVQYMGDCAFRVTIRRSAEHELKVYKFGSHAY